MTARLATTRVRARRRGCGAARSCPPRRAGDERMWAVGDEVDLDDAVSRPPKGRDRAGVAAASPPRCRDRIRVEGPTADEVHELDRAVEVGISGMELRVAPPGEARGDRACNLSRAPGHQARRGTTPGSSTTTSPVAATSTTTSHTAGSCAARR